MEWTEEETVHDDVHNGVGTSTTNTHHEMNRNQLHRDGHAGHSFKRYNKFHNTHSMFETRFPVGAMGHVLAAGQVSSHHHQL